jgi:hypothetical protein
MRGATQEARIMYTGQKFTRDQLVFVVGAAINAVFDRVESAFPFNTSDADWQEYKASGKFDSWRQGAAETCGMTLATLAAQLDNDGLAICDAIAIAGFDDVLDRWIEKGTAQRFRPKRGDSYWPTADIQKCAERFVDEVFDQYLGQTYKSTNDAGVTVEGYKLWEGESVEQAEKAVEVLNSPPYYLTCWADGKVVVVEKSDWEGNLDHERAVASDPDFYLNRRSRAAKVKNHPNR